MSWRRLPCSRRELRLDLTLACGQSFRWNETTAGEWTGVLAGKVWTLSQTDTHLLYTNSSHQDTQKPVKCHDNIKIPSNEFDATHKVVKTEPGVVIKQECYPESGTSTGTLSCDEAILTDYFQLDVNLHKLYQQWSEADPNFKTKATHFEGIRMLRQDPVENLFAFICSSNNNISRISGMVEKMCEEYGDDVGSVNGKSYFSFPSLERLAADNVEERLRELSFGYRAKYISTSARFIKEQKLGVDWLRSLRQMPYMEAKTQLMQLCGVGGKVADCVCLMSLDKLEAVPVDTHVWQIAARDYIPKLTSTKSLTDKLYQEIGDHFRKLWGDYAGWAHSILFCADLKKFQDKSPKKGLSPDKRKSAESTPKKTKRQK